MKQSGHQPLDKSHEEFFAGGELSAAGRFRTGKPMANGSITTAMAEPMAIGNWEIQRVNSVMAI